MAQFSSSPFGGADFRQGTTSVVPHPMKIECGFSRWGSASTSEPCEVRSMVDSAFMKSSMLAGILGLSLLIPASLGLLLTNVPSSLCPFPVLTIIPTFLLGSWHLSGVAVTLPTILFFAWNPGVIRGDVNIPKRSYILLELLTVLSIVWFLYGFHLGLKYQGAGYTYVISIVNATWLIILWLTFARARKRAASFATNIFVHWILFVWLAWYAFPYLGELP